MRAWTTILIVSRQPLSAALLALVCKLMVSLLRCILFSAASCWRDGGEPGAPYSGLAAGLQFTGRCSALRGRRIAGGPGGDDDDRLGEREVVGQREVDARLEARGRDAFELLGRAARQHYGGPPRAQVDH